METLTIRQAFDAMVHFLERQYALDKSDEIGTLLSSLSLQIWADDTTADPAAWDDWMESVQKVLMPDTPENRRLLEMLVSNRGNHLGTDMYGNEWYAEMLPDGRQVWAKVRNGEIKYGGIRRTPKSFDPKKGLSSPNDP
jgi:hypothetical protein